MKQRKWGMISLIGMVFILPVLFAWLFYTKADEWNLATTNRGVLLQPPLQINELAPKSWRGKWLLLYVDTQCADYCVTAAANLAEINIVLGKESGRLRSVLATLPFSESYDEPDTKEFAEGRQVNPQLEHLILSSPSMQQLLNADYLIAAEAPNLRQALFIVDPLGNIILYYAVPFSTKAVYRDMKKLLKASQIG
jgi:cytochrome oxidase Cu insertion factor (SCO1/SenC/PrrC family)